MGDALQSKCSVQLFFSAEKGIDEYTTDLRKQPFACDW